MQLTLDTNTGDYVINRYQPGEIIINHQTYQKSVIISHNQLIIPWHPNTYSELTVDDLQIILTLPTDIVILGTGAEQHFPSPQLQSIFFEKNIGIEVMSTQAACRTFNVLTSEDRKVVAALLIN